MKLKGLAVIGVLVSMTLPGLAVANGVYGDSDICLDMGVLAYSVMLEVEFEDKSVTEINREVTVMDPAWRLKGAGLDPSEMVSVMLEEATQLKVGGDLSEKMKSATAYKDMWEEDCMAAIS